MGATESYFEDIHVVINDKLSNARCEIKAAIAWFTDPDLIELIANKARNGVNVELVVADNEDNRRVNYDPLRQAGVNLTVFPQRGYGSMHHKFCIIDGEMVITGSYNWTVNARRNNGENIMISRDSDTVENYLRQFNDLKQTIQNGVLLEPASQNGHSNGVEVNMPEPIKIAGDQHRQNQIEDDFEKEWNVYLNSHVLNYNREELKTEGRNSAESTQGNSEVILMYLDSIYQNLLSDTSIDDHERVRLLNRLDQRMTFYSDKAKEEAASSTHVSELNKMAKQRNLENSIINFRNTQDRLEIERTAIETTRIPILESEKENLRKSIEELSIDITPPPLKRRLWIEGGMLSILSLYLFVFYSSVIYTILYGRQDAMDYLKKFGVLPEVEVFNGDALQLAVQKGWIVLFFVCLFTILPFVFGYLFHQLKKISKARWAYVYLTTAIILDGLLAYLITKNIYDIEYLTSPGESEWHPMMAFAIARFWIVLFMGAVPYMVWGALMEHIWGQLDKASRSELHHRRELQIQHLRQRNNEKENEINQLRNYVTNLNCQINELKGRIETTQRDIDYADYELELKKHQIQQELNLKLTTLANKKEKIIAYLRRDQIPVSYNALKDRLMFLMC